MKFSNLPQPIAVKLLELDERVNSLMTAADRADKSVEHSRAILSNRIEVDRIEYQKTQSGFNAVLAEAQQTRARADTERGMLRDIRQWIEQLPHDTKLTVLAPPTNADDLATLEAQLQALRQEQQRLQHIVIPSDDVASRVHEYVRSLAAQGAPLLRGTGNGQTLEVRWPTGPDVNRLNGNGFSTIDGNGLYLAAMTQPAALVKVIMHEIQSSLPMPKAEIQARLAELPTQIDDLSYVVASLRDTPDPAMQPPHWLGVRINEEEPQKLAV